MSRGELRFDRSAITVEHATARGRVLRNTGNFTRGSQLIGHQVFMFVAGAKVPFLIWFAIFVAIYWIMLSAVMGESEIQLCAWKLYAAVWGWLDFNPLKPMNLKMPDGFYRMTAMGYIPHLPAVKLAWAKAAHSLLGAFFASVLVAMPLVWGFIKTANTRGSSILQERHERGAMLVDRDILTDDILAHNAHEFEKSAARLFPGLTTQEVLKLDLATRKEKGLHHPYSVGGVPYPYGLEQSHSIIVGTTGSGKTTQLLDLVQQMRARQDSAVIFDLTGAFVEAFFDADRDIILNPNDARCPSWSIFADCKTQTEFTAAAQALVPSDGANADPFWAMAARTLFIEMCMKLIASGQGTNQALSDYLMTADLKNVHRILRDTIADPITAPEAARMAESIRAVFNTNAQALRFLPEDGPQFSIGDWIRRKEKPGSILFITARHVDMAMNKALLTLWMDLAINTLMTLPRTRELRTWFIFDELGALHRLPAIENGLQTARGFGGAMVLGLHSFAKLTAIYGREGAENLTSLARTKLILATADRKTAEACAEFIGNREVRQMDEAYSYGYNNLRDASTLTPRKQVEPLVIADDITNLPALHGFVKFPDGFPAARIKLNIKHYPSRAQGFEPRRIEPVQRPPWSTPQPPPPGTHEGGRDVAAEGVRTPEEVATSTRQKLAMRQALGIIPGMKADAKDASKANADDAASIDASTISTNTELARLDQKIEPQGGAGAGEGRIVVTGSLDKLPGLDTAPVDQSLRELGQDLGDDSGPSPDGGMEMEL
ncbi:type IV secretion system DNA-binding domain-containing protein [Sphingomonas sp. SUN039]|uniref:type IV secretion system DNA-binding domain-containing protein n=1 Tax=Sphingomonas sp. SUN039 TaxID=2937787 RepID=UPI002164E692|nr:type IV secretion system DNA-binding domain-containing protein [Sphingomonas sp. SUN039]UVO53720.1 type IV secretion system DNA-binding domain-containing protein [Sphingomonas sp. SUN039]